MAQQETVKQKKTLLTKLSVAESLGINREPITMGRFKAFFRLFSGKYGELFLLNATFLLFCVPALAILFYMLPYAEKYITSGYSFTGNIGFAYPGAVGDFTEAMTRVYDERIKFYAILIPCFTLIGLGAAGLFYCARNHVWRTPVKIRRHFWRGIKLHWWKFMIAFTVVGLAVFAVASTLFYNQKLALTGADNFGTWCLFAGAIIIAVALVSFLFYYLPMTVSYRLKYLDNVKNSIVLVISMALLSVMFIILLAGPLFLGSVSIIGILFMIFFVTMGFSFYALAVTSIAQYSFDNTIDALYEIERMKAEKEKLKQLHKDNARKKAQAKTPSKKRGKK